MQNIPHSGLISIQFAANALILDLVANGFNPIYPSTIVAATTGNPGTIQATLEATSAVDSLVIGSSPNNVKPMPWRIAIDANYTGAGTANEGVNAFMRVFMGTPEQLLNDGTVTHEFTLPTKAGGSTPPAPTPKAVSTATTLPLTAPLVIGSYTVLDGDIINFSSLTVSPGLYTAHVTGNTVSWTAYSSSSTTTAAPSPTGAGAPGESRSSGELSSGLFYPASSGNTQAGLAVPFFCYDGANFNQDFGSTIVDVSAHPISTLLTVTSHGLAFFIWVEGQDTMGNKHSWFCVQRLVDPATGNIVPVTQNSRFPVFCLYSVGGGEPDNTPLIGDLAFGTNSLPTRVPCIYKMIVREQDINRPSMPVNACLPSPDQAPIINAHAQVSIYEDQTFSLTMPSNFNTDRYKYKEQMDLVLYTSANVISPFNTVTLTMFGRTRVYTAMLANLPDNTGMRMLMLTVDSAV